MSGTVLDDIELIIEDVHGHNGGKPPSRDGEDGGGDDSGRDGNSPEPRRPGSRKYSTAVAVAMLSIVMFFMVLTAAFLVLRTEPQNLHTWAGIRLPRILWLNTCLLMASSATLEIARRRLSMDDSRGFHRMWAITTALGVLFVVGQVIAWRQLAAQGFYETSRMASGFFYVFTVLHAVHLLGGLCALLYVGWHKLDASRIGRPLAVEVASYYWHFMDGLWLFLLALLNFGQ
jgi:cytochrome c oxidase subunit III